MQNDEEEIKELVSTWMAATKAGDVETILSLMADDVVFLIPGQPVMRKADFAAMARAQSGQPPAPTFDGTSEIQEVKVLGDWAFLWTRLTVVLTPPGGRSMTRAGYTLSILNKQNGRWVLARDANLLAPALEETNSGDYL